MTEAPAVELTAPAVRRQAAADEPGASLPMGLVIAGGVATVGLAVWLARRAMRSNRANP